MDNVPADVVRTMGATRVVAVNVGDLTDRKTIDYSLFAVAGATLDAMMRANTRVAIKGADIIINVPLAENYRLARLAPQLRPDCRGLRGRRVDARQPPAIGRQ